MNIEAVDDWLSHRDTILASLTKKLTKAQQRMKHDADQRRRDMQFEEGDWVLVKLRPRQQTSVTEGHYSKLAKRFYGPFQVTKKIGTIAYQFNLLATSRIHPVFHYSLLKPYLTPTNQVDAPLELPNFAEDNQPIITPLTILDAKWENIDIGRKLLVLVQWQGLFPEDTSWEKWEDLKLECNLEDKVALEAHGDVMTKNKEQQNTEKEENRRPRREINKPRYLRDFA